MSKRYRNGDCVRPNAVLYLLQNECGVNCVEIGTDPLYFLLTIPSKEDSRMTSENFILNCNEGEHF